MNVLLTGRVFDDIESAIELNEQIQQAIDQLKKTKINWRMKRFGQDVYLVDHKLWQTIQNKMENMTEIIMIMERYTLINVHKQNDQLIEEQKRLNLQLQQIIPILMKKSWRKSKLQDTLLLTMINASVLEVKHIDPEMAKAIEKSMRRYRSDSIAIIAMNVLRDISEKL